MMTVAQSGSTTGPFPSLADNSITHTGSAAIGAALCTNTALQELKSAAALQSHRDPRLDPNLQPLQQQH